MNTTGTWYITIVDKSGFTLYDVVDDIDFSVNDIGEAYNVVAGNKEMWLNKEHCSFNDHHIYYRTDQLEILIEAEGVL